MAEYTKVPNVAALKLKPGAGQCTLDTGKAKAPDSFPCDHVLIQGYGVSEWMRAFAQGEESIVQFNFPRPHRCTVYRQGDAFTVECEEK